MQAVIIAIFSIYSLSFAPLKGGVNDNLFAIGMMVYGMCVVVTNLKVIIFSNTFTFGSIIIILLSILLYLFSLLVIDKIVISDFFNIIF